MNYREKRIVEVNRAIGLTKLEVQRLAESGLASDGWHSTRLRNLEAQLEILQESLDRTDGDDDYPTRGESVKLDEVIKAVYDANRSRDILTITLVSCLVGTLAVLIYLCARVVS